MNDQSMTASDLLEEWNGMKAQLEDVFRKREQKNAKLLMEKGIALFNQFLNIANDLDVSIGKVISYDELDVKPVNLKERLEFIISRPHLYHSYRQLSELMIELQKLYVKNELIKKSSSRKS
ncbi:YpoC family protein [Neobacillus mesonae]|uniref:YpoC-like domain-containing protein n=1 Tax=Neobacillus mesonae TaxID=1193713 RepID=A0A3Q9QWQ2_9BACI|nr:hypothetical protein [Neobacillus mesonae]AZU63118.1 hypothetical protein CHR53_18675 [Neobacillus mesonae]